MSLRTCKLAVCLGLVGLLLPFAARADSALLSEATGLGGTVMWLNTGAPGMVLVVVRGGDALIEGYGETTKGNGRVPDPHSLFRIGSITKVFATEVLAGLAVEGKLKLTDPLSRFAPKGAQVPAFGGRAITLLDLATQSAGLPREIGEVPQDAAPLTWPTREQRWAWLADFHLPWPPGTTAAYSNVGFALLADALGTAAGEDYPALLRDLLTRPLGMIDTGFTPTKEQCDRLMTGTGLGGAGPCVDTTATAGSGGLYSTGSDMARWLRHNLADNDPTSWSALALAHAVYRQRQAMAAAIGFDEAGPMDGLALGWVVMAAHDHTPLIVQKAGGGAGFMSYVAFAPGRDVGIFVVVNRADFGMFHGLTAAANGMLANLVTR
jgi:D-alanyl-D-alanine-carboxypeptidase/D-alanyl-D-alanine-endopeptidase